MTTAHDIDWPQMLADRLTSTSPDVLRELLMVFLHTLMGAEADALCGASYGERSAERTNQRNGYRRRQFDTRTGTLDLARLRWPFQGVPARGVAGPCRAASNSQSDSSVWGGGSRDVKRGENLCVDRCGSCVWCTPDTHRENE